jgi:hypothetical protein
MPSRLLRRNPGTHFALDFAIKVISDLVLEIALNLRTVE